MPDKTKIITTSSAQTRLIKNGMVYIQPTIIKKPLKPLFVLFAYAGKNGAKEMLIAARFKEKRLRKRYPNANVRIINTFKYPSHFKAEWTKLYKYLTKSEIANEYSLWEVHYFGHGGPESLYLEKEGGRDGANSEIFFNDSDNMERLPWSTNKGIFVLHACRTAAFEDTLDKKKIEAQTCIANTISKNQKTRCLGQTVGANYNIDISVLHKYSPEDTGFVLIAKLEQTTTARQDAEKFKYRAPRRINYVLNEKFGVDRVLWGYALLTGLVYENAENNQIAYKRLFNKSYPMYEEIKILGPKSQIMPCRVFNDGVLEENRIVKAGYFNNNDLEYI